jgi:predicted dehydrogenase
MNHMQTADRGDVHHSSPSSHAEQTTALRRPLTMAIAGAGARGFAYAEEASRLSDRAEVVAVAEPRDLHRTAFAEQFDLAPENVFSDWRDLAARPRLADLVVISVLDDQHVEAAVAFAGQGYDILLEKPMATSLEGCLEIEAAVKAAGVALAVCHVLRYTPYTLALQEVLAAGTIGDIVSIEHLEPIGHLHFAHSFVRGNWRNEEETSSLLLQKSCHDIDWLGAIVDRPVVRVSSFGSLKHFRAEERPASAGDRCIVCPVEKSCAFSAARFYRNGLHGSDDNERYMTRVMAPELTEEAVELALAEGPYGRCVYACDNDVVDHQVVQLEYEGGVTASFTLTAFTPGSNRKTRIFGTRGQITGDGQHLEIFDFFTERTTTLDTLASGHSASAGHGGGDRGLMESLVNAMHSGRPEDIPSGLAASLASHRVVFAAEQARRSGTVVEL